jgi:hypothetical protein
MHILILLSLVLVFLLESLSRMCHLSLNRFLKACELGTFGCFILRLDSRDWLSSVGVESTAKGKSIVLK